MEPKFVHAEEGTPEQVWLRSDQWDQVPVMPLGRMSQDFGRVLVLSAHPDDETLGVGGTIATLAAAGVPVWIVVATAGESSHPHATTWTKQALAEVRRGELADAVKALGVQRPVVELGFPDGGLPAAEERLTAEVTALLQPNDLVLAPWWNDGHSDHDALGRAARAAAGEVGCSVAYYPVWLWHWDSPATFPWSRARTVELTTAAAQRKQTALKCFPSQTEPLGPARGDAPVLDASHLARANRLIETLFLDGPVASQTPAPSQTPALSQDCESSSVSGDFEKVELLAARGPESEGLNSGGSAASAAFEAMYEGTDDPWGFEDSFYEARKRALTLAVLSQERYSSILDIGCATGLLTCELAQRANSVVGMDFSARALKVAARRESAVRDRLTWVQGTAPRDVPTGPFDLILLSEVGYFLTPTGLLATFRRIQAARQPHSEVVLVHWRHPTTGIPLTGELVHAQARAFFGAPRAIYGDTDVLIDVWSTTSSPAAVEGLVPEEVR